MNATQKSKKSTGDIIFGPVPSRRLGRSLGVDILPLKTCNLNCIYCELGPTRYYTQNKTGLTPCKEIISCFHNFLQTAPIESMDVVTITASGEPTLHPQIGEILRGIKEESPVPVAVLTNATLLKDPEVLSAIKAADIILPSLDAGTERTFVKVNRPAPGVRFKDLVEGLLRLRDEFQGKILLEVLFVKGVNDTEEEIECLLKYVELIDPNEVQINTVARPPAETWARPVPQERLTAIRAMFGTRARIITSFKTQKGTSSRPPTQDEILDMLKRRPLSQKDLKDLFGAYEKTVLNAIKNLMEDGLVKKEPLDQELYYHAR